MAITIRDARRSNDNQKITAKVGHAAVAGGLPAADRVRAAVRATLEQLEGRTLFAAGDVLSGPITTAVSGFRFDYRSGITTQADGKIVVAGYVNGGATGQDLAVARYLPDGTTLDTSFDTDGVASLPVAGDQFSNGVAIDGAGNIFAAGTSAVGNNRSFAVGRFSSTGSTGGGFGAGGYVSTDFFAPAAAGAPQFARGFAIAVRPTDNKVIVGGTAFNPAQNRNEFALARYNADGTPDATFGGGTGRVTTNAVTSGNSDEVTDIALQNDGKIVVSGTNRPNAAATGTAFVIARYTTAGALDASFDGDGIRSDLFGGASAEAAGVAVLADGSIVGGGHVTDLASASDFAVARYSGAGAPLGSRTFNVGGAGDRAGNLAVQTIGGTQKLVLSGSTNADGGDFAVARLNLDLTLDNTFAGDGIATLASAPSVGRVPGLAVQNQVGPYRSSLVVAGVSTGTQSADPDVPSTADALRLARFDALPAAANNLPAVYVNDDWTVVTDTGTAGRSFGDTVVDGPTGIVGVFGVDAFASIQAGVNAVDAAGTVNLLAGSYAESVTVAKSVTIDGQGAGPAPVANWTTAAAGGTLVRVTSTVATDDVTLQDVAFDGLNGSLRANEAVRVDVPANFDALTVARSTFTRFGSNAVSVNGDAAAGVSARNVVVTDSSFTNNGTGGDGGAGDISLFQYNGNAAFTNLTLVGAGTAATGARLGIQLRGVGAANSAGVLPIGTVAFSNVDVSGSYRTQMVGLQRYANVAGLTLSGLKLGGATSAIAGTFGASLRLDNVGTGSLAAPATIDLGDTLFRGLAPTSAQRHELEFAPDNTTTFLRADATDTTWRVGGVDVPAAALTVTQAFAVEDRVLHYVDKLNPPNEAVTFKGFADVQAGRAFVTDDGALGEGSIQRAIEVVPTAGTVHVEGGSYAQNVLVTKSLTLSAENGRAATTIVGVPGVAGTVTVAPGVNDVTIGQAGKGFTIVGIDNGSAGSENAAVYLQGAHTNVQIRSNDIVANGDLGLVTEFGQTAANFVVDGNIFSGQSFTGAAPAASTDQFNVANVARPLVFFGGNRSNGGNPVTNLQFTNNTVTGTAGTVASGYGNHLVAIDANGATITGNQFTGTTASTATGIGASSLRVGGTNNTVSGNTVGGAAHRGIYVLGQGTGMVVQNNTFNGVNADSQLRLEAAGVAVTGNTFTGDQAVNATRASYSTGAYTPDGLYDANSFSTAVSVRTGGTFDSTTGTPAGGTYLPALFANIQGGVNAAVAGPTTFVHAYKGTYNEQVGVNKTLVLEGAQNGVDARTGRSVAADEAVVRGAATGPTRSTAFYVTANDVVIDGFTVRDTNNDNLFGAGIVLGSGGGGVVGTTLTNNIVTANSVGVFIANGGAAAGDQLVVSRNFIHDNTAPGTLTGTGIYSDQSIAGGVLRNVLIDSNRISEPTGNAVNLGGVGAGWVQDVTISNNTLSALGSVVYLQDTTRVTVDDNDITTGISRAVAAFTGGTGGTNTDLTVTDNDVTVAAGTQTTGDRAVVFAEAVAGTTTVSSNEIAVTGTLGGGVTSLTGIDVRGTGTVNLATNTVTGGGVLGSLTKAINVQNASVLNLTNNTLTGFTSGGTIAGVPVVAYVTSGGADAVTVAGTGPAAGTLQHNANQAVAYTTAITTLTVDAAGGTDTVNVLDTDTSVGTITAAGGGQGDVLNYETSSTSGAADFVKYAATGSSNQIFKSATAAATTPASQLVNWTGFGTSRVRTHGGNDDVRFRQIIGSVARNYAIETGAGDDLVSAGLGNDEIRGGAGNDNLTGGNGNDTIFGEADNDTVFGGIGDDTIDGGTGSNQLSGQNGNDTFFARNGFFDNIDGGTGFDAAQIDVFDGTNGIEVFLA